VVPLQALAMDQADSIYSVPDAVGADHHSDASACHHHPVYREQGLRAGMAMEIARLDDAANQQKVGEASDRPPSHTPSRAPATS